LYGSTETYRHQYSNYDNLIEKAVLLQGYSLAHRDIYSLS
jgi:hypothetical protein